MKQNKKSRKLVHAPSGRGLGFIGFISVFAVLGGIVLYFRSQAAVPYVSDPAHRAQCITANVSKQYVRPGEQFSGYIQIKNVGSSTFAPGFGWGFGEARDGPPIWGPSGAQLTSNIPPGGVASFNITSRAPSSPGTYGYDWGMAIGIIGFVRDICVGPRIVVQNPPSISLRANGQSSNISLTKGKALTLSWDVGNDPLICNASGTWGGGRYGNGSESRSSDTKTTGTKSYTLSCSNQVGTSSATRIVTVTAPPTTSTPSSPSTGSNSGSGTATPRTSTGSSGSNGNRSTTSAPRTATGQPTTNSQQVSVEPIQPPIPTNFSALTSEDSSITLSWELPEYLGALSGYELERSTDNEKWERIGPESLVDPTYLDTSTDFQTTYYYRVRALEASGLKSDYASVEATTGEFSSNLNPEGTTLVSDDQSVSVFIPKDAIEGEASCNLYNNNDVLPPAEDNYSTLTGPYDILCKNKDGTIIESFKLPIEITVTENTAYKNIRYFSYQEENWQEIQIERTDNTAKFTLQDQITFVGIGQEKTTPLWVKILIALLIVGGIIIGGFIILKLIIRIRQRNAYQSQSEDYYRKEHGY
jgi:hypothetical protein